MEFLFFFAEMGKNEPEIEVKAIRKVGISHLPEKEKSTFKKGNSNA
jgi:hypothetical protein